MDNRIKVGTIESEFVREVELGLLQQPKSCCFSTLAGLQFSEQDLKSMKLLKVPDGIVHRTINKNKNI
jgi:serine/threonine protein kinase HipA of HipAB toxin-antitoxin module